MIKKTIFSLSAIALFAAMISSGMSSCQYLSNKNAAAVDSDSIKAVQEQERIMNTPLPVTPLPSVADLKYEVIIADSTVSGELSTLIPAYNKDLGSFTFRGGPYRDADYNCNIKGTPTKIVKLWTFETAEDFTKTPMGSWGGGVGWTGQPVYVNWPDSVFDNFRKEAKGLTPDFAKQEIMIGSLCHKIYFLNFQNGKETREPIDVVNPVKGSISLDPSLNGNLYIGQAVPIKRPFGQMALNLYLHDQIYFSGQDKGAYVGWCGNDSSPICLGGFMFHPSENGTIYKYKVSDRGLTLHSCLRYKGVRGAAGTENSMAIYRNYGYFGNNNGDVLCIDLNTLKPIWHYDNHDDIDASIVIEVVDNVPYLYVGCEVDRQGVRGMAHFAKLNGLTGEAVWEQEIPCKKLNIGKKHFDGGFYSTPLLGHGDCEGMLFTNVCHREGSSKAEFTAFSTKTGEAIYRVMLDHWAWTSPIPFYNEQGKLFIFTGDSGGNGYLFEAKTGKKIYQEHLANNFESTPVVVGNQFVVGSRGKQVHKFEIQ